MLFVNDVLDLSYILNSESKLQSLDGFALLKLLLGELPEDLNLFPQLTGLVLLQLFLDQPKLNQHGIMFTLHLAHIVVDAQQCHEIAAEAMHVVEWVQLAEGGRSQQLTLQNYYLLLKTLSVFLELPKDAFELLG